jgi:hypothetical protein
MNREAVDLLRELVSEIRGLRGDLRRRNAIAAPALSAADVPRLRNLLLAVNGACADAVWPVNELATLALVDAGLAAALKPHLPQSGSGGLRRLGWFLSRCAGHSVAGFRLLRVGDAREGALWQVKRV